MRATCERPCCASSSASGSATIKRRTPNRKDHSILARDRTDLITRGGSLLNESPANRSKGLDVLLIQRLDRNPVNTRTHRRLADRQRIIRVVLLVFGKGLHVLRRDYCNAKASLEQIPTPEASRRTRLHRYERRLRKLFKYTEKLCPRNFPVLCNGSIDRQRANLENVLDQINTDYRDVHLCLSPYR